MQLIDYSFKMKFGQLDIVVIMAIIFGLMTTLALAGVDPEMVKKGKSDYYSYCVNCHGPNMVNTGTRSYDLRKFPLNAKPRFIKSVKDGVKDMPAWKDVLDDAQIEQLWAYVKTRGKS